MELHLDCRYFVGEKPCRFNRLCAGCPHYEPLGRRILIIKLAALGDVLRTTPLLPALRKLDAAAHITWVTDEAALDLLRHNAAIDRLLGWNLDTVLRLEVEQFDWLICLDKEVRATALAAKIRAARKSGFGLHASGNIAPLNPESDYLFSLGMSDDIKFRHNERSYQALTFEALGLTFEGEPLMLALPQEVARWAEERWLGWGLEAETRCIGINTGGGELFANKSLPAAAFAELIEILAQRLAAGKSAILLFGGPLERDKNRDILRAVSAPVIDTGTGNSLLQFAALLGRCHTVLTSDSLGMHLAVALQRRVVVLFGPTCEQEIELYGRGSKVVAGISCSPCYRRTCDKTITCMNTLSLREIVEKLLREATR